MSDKLEIYPRPPELTLKQEQFSQLVGEGSSLVDAYSNAYGVEKQKAYWLAHKLVKDNPKIKERIAEIQKACRERFIELAPEALDRLEDLATNGKNEQVRLKANTEILDRSGLQAPQRIELAAVGVFGSASAEDIRNQIRQDLEGDKKNGNVSTNN